MMQLKDSIDDGFTLVILDGDLVAQIDITEKTIEFVDCELSLADMATLLEEMKKS